MQQNTEPNPRRVGRALLSTWDKTGLLPFARALAAAGVELICSGGTGDHLAAAGLAVTDVATLTGHGSAFAGRLKTLSFEIAAALLHDRERDAVEATTLGVVPIDLVVCNLYPFEAAVRNEQPLDTLVESLDVGGPTMLRAAAKNHRFVTVVTDDDDYAEIAAQIGQFGGTTAALRLRLAAKAFERTAAYDTAIARAFVSAAGLPTNGAQSTSATPLRYGENPHQAAWVHAPTSADALRFDQLGGKALSYNNYLDLRAALDAIVDLPRAAVAVIKHENPCGLATAGDAARALELAWGGDPLSAFGSVIASNVPLSGVDVQFFALDAADKGQRKFVEIIAAPGFDGEARAYLAQHKSLRVLVVEPASGRRRTERREVRGLVLEQEADQACDEALTFVSRLRPPLDEALVRFGLVAARQVKSNGVVLVQRLGDGAARLLGMGAGQPNRLASTALALSQAQARLQAEASPSTLGDVVLVSDAFFPFADGVQLALDAGVRTLVQPGGSIRDAEIVAACDAQGAALVFTGRRHFRH